jgi:PAS domain S-box-containing protein
MDGTGAMDAAAWQSARALLSARMRAEPASIGERDWLQVTLASIGDAVISTDVEGRVTFMNPVAEALTGWSRADAAGQPLATVFRILDEHSREPVADPALRAIAEDRVVGLVDGTLLIARDGKAVPIDDSTAPIRDDRGAPIGAVLVFREREQGRMLRQIADASLLIHSAGSLAACCRPSPRRPAGSSAPASPSPASTPTATRTPARPPTPTRGPRRRHPARLRRPRPRGPPHQRGDAPQRRRRLARGPVHRPRRPEPRPRPAVRKPDGDFTDSDEAVLVQLAHIASVASRTPGCTPRCATRTAARTSSWRSSPTSCETRSRRSATACRSSACPGPRRPRAGPGHDGPPARPHGPPDRRPPRHLAHQPQQDRAAARAGPPGRGHAQRRRDRPAADRRGRPHLEVALPLEPVVLDADLTRLAQVFSNLLTNSAKYTDRPAGASAWSAERTRATR